MNLSTKALFARTVPCLLLPLLASTIEADAQLKAEPAAVDFGRARQEKTLRAPVTLTNIGAKPLEILHVGADCSCTGAAPLQTSIAPGASTQLEVSFDTRTYQGLIRRRVVLQTTEGELVVPVSATISPYERWLPGAYLAMLPPSNRGEPAETTFHLEYLGDADVSVKEVRPSAPWLRLTPIETTEGKFAWKVTKDPKAPAGTHQPKVTVVTTDEKEPEVTFDVFAQVHSRLSATPNPILMPDGKVGETVHMPLSLVGWEADADPRGELENGTVVVEARDKIDALLQVSVKLTEPGSRTQFLKLYAGDELEAEFMVITRAEP